MKHGFLNREQDKPSSFAKATEDGRKKGRAETVCHGAGSRLLFDCECDINHQLGFGSFCAGGARGPGASYDFARGGHPTTARDGAELADQPRRENSHYGCVARGRGVAA